MIPAALLHRVLGAPTAGPLFTRAAVDLVYELERVSDASVFVALNIERSDGSVVAANSDIPAAIERGAAAVIYDPRRGEVPLPERVRAYVVGDVLSEYRRVAREWRRMNDLIVVAVAGSAGKTTTKNLIACLLAETRSVHATPGTRNGYVGAAHTILGVTPEHRMAVVEIGIDACGAMASHAEMVLPQAAVLTTLGPEHLDRLFDLDTVVREETELFRFVAAQPGGVLFVNLDDPLIVDAVERIHGGRRIAFTLSARTPPSAGYEHVCRGRVDADLLRVTGRTDYTVRAPLQGSHNLSNTLAAIAVAEHFGVGPIEIAAALGRCRPELYRTQVERLAGVEVICDCYNANPPSTAAALAFLAERRRARGGRAWACLGGMAELGEEEEQLHRNVGMALADRQIERAVLLDGPMRYAAATLRSLTDACDVQFVTTPEEMADVLLASMRAGDVVLIKGSRCHRMERVWERLKACCSDPCCPPVP